MAVKTIILHGNNLDSNRGCQALRQSTRLILERFLPDHQPLNANIFFNDQLHSVTGTDASAFDRQLWETRRRGTPEYFLWGGRLVCSRLIGRYPPMKVHHAIDNASALLAVGGDNLSFDYGLLATLLFMSPLNVAVKKSVPAVVWGASVGPFGSRPSWEKRFATLLKRLDLITVRESLTREYLDGLDIRENVHQAADPAFLLPAVLTELTEDIEQALRRGAIGVNLSPLMKRYYAGVGGDWHATAIDMLAEIRRKTDGPIILIPHVMMPPSIFPDNDDYGFMASLLRHLPHDARHDVLLYDARNADCRQIKWVISRLRVFAGTRMHSAIAALSSGVPAFGIGYSVKTRGIYRDIFGHEEWVAHVSQLESGRLAERICTMMASEHDVRRHLSRIMPTYSETAWKCGELLASIIRR